MGILPFDDWFYHLNHGEVHCATNVLRRPTTKALWWEFDPTRVAKSPPSESKHKVEEAQDWRKVPVDDDGDCFFHAVLYYTDRPNHRKKSAVADLREKVARRMLENGLVIKDDDTVNLDALRQLVEAKLADTDYVPATQSLLELVADDDTNYTRFVDAHQHDAGNFLGVNIIDAVYRLPFYSGDKTRPPKVTNATIWGDSTFIGEVCAAAEGRQIWIYRLGENGKPALLACAGSDQEIGADEDEAPIKLLLSADNNHFDAIVGENLPKPVVEVDD